MPETATRIRGSKRITFHPSLVLQLGQSFYDLIKEGSMIEHGLMLRLVECNYSRVHDVYDKPVDTFSAPQAAELDALLASLKLPPKENYFSGSLKETLEKRFPPIPYAPGFVQALKAVEAEPDDTLAEACTVWESELSPLMVRISKLESAQQAVLDAAQVVAQHESTLRIMLETNPVSAPNAATDVVAVAEEYRRALHDAKSEVDDARSTEEDARITLAMMLSADEQQIGIERVLVNLQNRAGCLQSAIDLATETKSAATV